MTVTSDLATVVALACETSDRTDAEHAALLRVADRLDRDRNANTASNRRFDHRALPVACDAPWHTGTGRCVTCSTMDPRVRLNVRPFTVRAKAEPLVDEAGWSVAAAVVDQTRAG